MQTKRKIHFYANVLVKLTCVITLGKFPTLKIQNATDND